MKIASFIRALLGWHLTTGLDFARCSKEVEELPTCWDWPFPCLAAAPQLASTQRQSLHWTHPRPHLPPPCQTPPRLLLLLPCGRQPSHCSTDKKNQVTVYQPNQPYVTSHDTVITHTLTRTLQSHRTEPGNAKQGKLPTVGWHVVPGEYCHTAGPLMPCLAAGRIHTL